MALEISRHDGWLRHLAKFNFACALTFLVKSIVKVSCHQNELKHANSIPHFHIMKGKEFREMKDSFVSKIFISIFILFIFISIALTKG